jgi:hypothetical protein
MQKLGIIDDIGFWFEARILRNRIAHPYIADRLENLYEEFYEKSKAVFKTIGRIERYLNKVA